MGLWYVQISLCVSIVDVVTIQRFKQLHSLKMNIGFATYSQLPTRKGYDSFYGYLSKSMDYFKKTKIHNDGCICSSMEFHDLWHNEQPISALDKSRYSELEFAERVLDTIDAHNQDDGPLFVMYSSHLPHSPAQIPKEYLLSDSIHSDTDEVDEMDQMEEVEDTNLCQRLSFCV